MGRFTNDAGEEDSKGYPSPYLPTAEEVNKLFNTKPVVDIKDANTHEVLGKAELIEVPGGMTAKIIPNTVGDAEKIRQFFNIGNRVHDDVINLDEPLLKKDIDEAMKIFTEKETGLLKGEVRTVSITGGAKGVKPARFDLVPVGPLTQLAILYGNGAAKYAAHNYRLGYDWSMSYAAAMRHLTEFWDGADYDDEMKVPHVINAVFHLFALCEFLMNPEKYGRFDDRYTGAKEPEVEGMPTHEEEALRIAAILWNNNMSGTDIEFKRAWELRDHDSFTELRKETDRIYNSALDLLDVGVEFRDGGSN